MFKNQGALPTFLIIGAMRAGTTSLHHYLQSHPQIGMSRRKELNFFVVDKYWPGNWQRGANWYAAQFDSRSLARGEASPSYANFPQFDGVPERMHSVLPDTKLIYLVRDPIERLISDYRLLLTMGFVAGPLREVLADERLTDLNCHLVQRSCYFKQLSRYMPFYKREQIHLVVFEELRDNRETTLKTLFQFLGVDADFSCGKFGKKFNESGNLLPQSERDRALARRITMLCYHFPFWQGAAGAFNKWMKNHQSPNQSAAMQEILYLDDVQRQRLQEYFAPDVQALSHWARCDFSIWNSCYKN